MDATRSTFNPPGEIWLTRDALALGHDHKSIARLVRSGDWHRLRHGAYCLGEAWRRGDERTRRMLLSRAVYVASRTHILLSHTSALDVMGIDFWDLDGPVHLTRTDGRAGRREAGVAQHCGTVIAEDVSMRHGFWVTSPTRTGLDCLAIGDLEHCLVVIIMLLRSEETTVPLMRRRLAAMVHWPHTLHSDLVLLLADDRIESIGEIRTWYLLWAQGLPMPVPQWKIYDRNGVVVARLDFAWPEFGVFLEFDGRVKYEGFLREGESATDAVLREKRREELVCGLTGWRCIRITWADLHRPERTAARIRATLAGQAWVA